MNRTADDIIKSLISDMNKFSDRYKESGNLHDPGLSKIPRPIEPFKEEKEICEIILENTLDLITLHNMNDYTCLYVNPAATTLLGYYPTELIGKTILEFIHPDDRNSLLSILNENSYTAEIRYLKKNNEYIWLELTGRIIHIPSGPLALLISHNIDKQKRNEFAHETNEYEYRNMLKKLRKEICKRKKVEQILMEKEAIYRELVENINDIIFRIDTRGIITYVSPIVYNLAHYTPDEITGRHFSELVHPEDLPAMSERFQQILDGMIHTHIPHEYRCKDKYGAYRHARVSMRPIYKDGIITGLTGIIIDITQELMSKKCLVESEQKFRRFVEESLDGIILSDEEGNIIEWNSAMEKICGINHRDAMGKKMWEINYQLAANNSTYDYMKSSYLGVLQNGKLPEDKSYIQTSIQTPDRIFKTIQQVSFPVKTDNGYLLASIVRDITQQKETEDQLRYMAMHDSLTGLYNRVYFEEKLRSLEAKQIDSIGIILCDIDGLKVVNDTLGHDAGDRMLVAASKIIKASVKSDSTIISRIGGDEFAILLPCCSISTINDICQKIKENMDNYNAGVPEFPMSISIGSTFTSSKSSISMFELFKQSDNNMNREKLYQSQSSRSTLLQTLMRTLEARDFITEGHVDRVQELSVKLAAHLGLEKHLITELRLLAQFHDIGKVGIPDSILFKPGSLTEEERKEMQRHSEIGYHIALSSHDLASIADNILKHHEWWNGKGYPLGLKGDEIPLSCRILAIADAYDAMVSDRPYRQALSHAEALSELKKGAGTQFDPELISKFIAIINKE